MLISKAQLRRFIQRYLGKLSQLASELSEEYKLKIFPRLLVKPYEIIGIISNVHGLAIEFVEEATTGSIRIFEFDKRIENAVLPQKSTRKVAFFVGTSRGCSIGRMGIYTEEFLEKHVEKAEGTVLVLKPPLEGIVQVSVGGDVVFYDIQFGAVVNGKPSIKTVRGALWLFGSNSARDFSVKQAERRAIEDFRRYLSFASLGMPKFPTQEQIQLSLKTLPERIKTFQGLIAKSELRERTLQDFFERNPEFLCLATYRRLFSQIRLKKTNGKELLPDFFLERVTDGYCDILDIKLPQKKIVTGAEQRRRFTAEVYDAIAQVREYKEYFDDEQNRKKIEKKYGLLVYKPDIIVLIGSSKNVDREELIKIRDHYPDVRIISYDEIVTQIVYLKNLLKRSIVHD